MEDIVRIIESKSNSVERIYLKAEVLEEEVRIK
jgi:hypothetical protein